MPSLPQRHVHAVVIVMNVLPPRTGEGVVYASVSREPPVIETNKIAGTPAEPTVNIDNLGEMNGRDILSDVPRLWLHV